MPAIAYADKNFRNPDKINIINLANGIIREYQAQGYILTLRQLYYRFIAKDLFPASWIDRAYNAKNGLDPDTKNTLKNYKRLGEIIGDGRLGGYIDWDAIEDRTRELNGISHWTDPADLIESAAQQYRVDKWSDQTNRLEVWIEKDAIESIAVRAAHRHDVPVFSCRGYGSLSSLWAAGNRLRKYIVGGQVPVILHLGDHDPSGVDMSRDIHDRMNNFVWTDLMRVALDQCKANGGPKQPTFEQMVAMAVQLYGITADRWRTKTIIEVRRIALTMEQIEEYDPPPNPVKVTDSRSAPYQELYGDDCWELDALEPSVLDALIDTTISEYCDDEKYEARRTYETQGRKQLRKISNNWPKIAKQVAKFEDMADDE